VSLLCELTVVAAGGPHSFSWSTDQAATSAEPSCT